VRDKSSKTLANLSLIEQFWKIKQILSFFFSSTFYSERPNYSANLPKVGHIPGGIFPHADEI
jgi:hypothetical protein